MKNIFLALAVLALPVLAHAGDTKDEAAIKAEFSAFESSWNKHDVKALAGHWTKDGSVINPEGKTANGQSEIEKLLTAEHNGWAKNTQATFKIDTTKFIRPDVAFVDATHTSTGLIGPDGKALPPQAIHLTAVLVKEGKGWKVSQARPYAYMTPPPAVKATAY